MMLYFENLIKEYDGRRILDTGVIRISDGALCGIIGPNGSGKSTLLNIAAGLMKPTSGDIAYGEERSPQVPYRDMTLVFQAPYLIRTTVWKNIAYPLKLRRWGSQQIEARVSELAEELGLTPFLKQKGWKLSGGEMQKVALARALAFRPKLLLLDEPTANVDPSTTAEIEKMLRKINEREKTTILVVTHDLAQARRLCGEILLLDRGRVIEQGKTTEVLKSPQHEWTKRFLAGELLT